MIIWFHARFTVLLQGDGHAALSELRATGRVRDPGHPEASAAAAAAAPPGRASYADTRDEPGPEYRDYDRTASLFSSFIFLLFWLFLLGPVHFNLPAPL